MRAQLSAYNYRAPGDIHEPNEQPFTQHLISGAYSRQKINLPSFAPTQNKLLVAIFWHRSRMKKLKNLRQLLEALSLYRHTRSNDTLENGGGDICIVYSLCQPFFILPCHCVVTTKWAHLVPTRYNPETKFIIHKYNDIYIHTIYMYIYIHKYI